MDFEIINKLNYAGKINIKRYGVHVKFYTKQQMKKIYPNKNYRIVGEIGNKTGIQCGATANFDIQPLPVYKERTHNRLTESVIGYTAVDDHSYLAVVRNVLVQRVVVIALVFALICAGTMIFPTHINWVCKLLASQASA